MRLGAEHRNWDCLPFAWTPVRQFYWVTDSTVGLVHCQSKVEHTMYVTGLSLNVNVIIRS